jgi:Spy/CpxP family protein refolding chaperone
MTRPILAGVASAALVLTVALSASAQRSFRWWRSEDVQKELALSASQISRIDEVFTLAIERQRKNKDILDELEAHLSTLIEEDADEAAVVNQIDKVETVRATLNKERTLMLLHMRKILTPAQQATYTARVDEWQREHPRSARPDGSRGPDRNQP